MFSGAIGNQVLARPAFTSVRQCIEELFGWISLENRLHIEDLEIEAGLCDVFVAGFESFYPTWKNRIGIFQKLARFSEIDAKDSHVVAQRTSRHALELLQIKYRSAFFGLQSSLYFGVSELGKLDATDQSDLKELFEKMHQQDLASVSEFYSNNTLVYAESSRLASCMSVLPHFLLVFLSHFYILIHHTKKSDAPKKVTDLGVLIFFGLINTILVNASKLLRHFLECGNGTQVDPIGISDFFSRTGVGQIIPFAILMLHQSLFRMSEPDNLHLVSSLIKSHLDLICQVASLQSSSGQRAGTPLNKAIALLREHRQLTQLENGVTQLSPYAREIFSMVFAEFRSISKDTCSDEQPYMTRQDFVRYRELCLIGVSAPTVPVDAEMDASFKKFFVEGHEKMNLSAFLDMHLALSVAHPRKVFSHLRGIEYCYDFQARILREHNERSDKYRLGGTAPLACLSNDLIVTMGGLLKYIFAAPSLLVAVEEDLDKVVPLLLHSQAQFRLASDFVARLEFLNKFITVSPTLQHERLFLNKNSLGRNQAVQTVSQIFASDSQFSEPCVTLSLLFQRCLSEMGGGTAARELSKDWLDAVRAEKAYAAACIKHNGLTDECIRFSRSVAIVELVVASLSKGIRCMFSPQCPQWFKGVVQSVWRDVRQPLLALFQARDDIKLFHLAKEAGSGHKEGDSKQREIKQKGKTMSPKANSREKKHLHSSSPVLNPSQLWSQEKDSAHEGRISPPAPRSISALTEPTLGSSLSIESTQQPTQLFEVLSSTNPQVELQPLNKSVNTLDTPRDAKIEPYIDNVSKIAAQDESELNNERGFRAKVDMLRAKILEHEQQLEKVRLDRSSLMDTKRAAIVGEIKALIEKISLNSLFLLNHLDRVDKQHGCPGEEAAVSNSTINENPDTIAAKGAPSRKIKPESSARSTSAERVGSTDRSTPSSSPRSASPPVSPSSPRRAPKTPTSVGDSLSPSRSNHSRTNFGQRRHSMARTPTAFSHRQGPSSPRHSSPRHSSPRHSSPRHKILSPTNISRIELDGSDDEPGELLVPRTLSDEPNSMGRSVSAFGLAGMAARSNYKNSVKDGNAAPQTGSRSPWSKKKLEAPADKVHPYDSTWIAKLVCTSSNIWLQSSLQPAIARVETMSRIRLQLLKYINHCFSLGYGTCLIETILPLILRCFGHSSRPHLLHRLQPVGTVDDDANDTLLSFYKNVVGMLNRILPKVSTSDVLVPFGEISLSQEASVAAAHLVSERKSAAFTSKLCGSSGLLALWFQIKNLLHILNSNFQDEDGDLLLGSGVFAALFRFIQGLERLTKTPEIVSVQACQKLTDLAWQSFKYLTMFTLSCDKLDKGVLAQSIGAQYFVLLNQNLVAIESLPPLLTLHEDRGILYQSLDIARVLLHFSKYDSVCSPAALQTLVSKFTCAPPNIRVLLCRILANEVPRYKPIDFQSGFTESLLDVTARCLLFPLGHLLGHLQSSSSLDSKPGNQNELNSGTDTERFFHTWRHPLHSFSQAPEVEQLISLLRKLIRVDGWSKELSSFLLEAILSLPSSIAQIQISCQPTSSAMSSQRIGRLLVALAIMGGFEDPLREGCSVVVFEDSVLIEGVVTESFSDTDSANPLRQSSNDNSTVRVLISRKDQSPLVADFHRDRVQVVPQVLAPALWTLGSPSALLEKLGSALREAQMPFETLSNACERLSVQTVNVLILHRITQMLVVCLHSQLHLLATKGYPSVSRSPRRKLFSLSQNYQGSNFRSLIPPLINLFGNSNGYKNTLSEACLVDLEASMALLYNRVLEVVMPFCDLQIADGRLGGNAFINCRGQHLQFSTLSGTQHLDVARTSAAAENAAPADTRLEFKGGPTAIDSNHAGIGSESHGDGSDEMLELDEDHQLEIDDGNDGPEVTLEPPVREEAREAKEGGEGFGEDDDDPDEVPLIVQHLQSLTDMGFPPALARMGLAQQGGNLHETLELIFNGAVENNFDEVQARQAWSTLLSSLGMLTPEHHSAARQRSVSRLRNLKATFYRTSTPAERARLISRIREHSTGSQGQIMNELHPFDFLDAKDAYGDWYLGQILKVRPSSTGAASFLVHFFGWDDLYNEWIPAQSERLRLASLFEQTQQRLQGDQYILKVKVYGNALRNVKTSAQQLEQQNLIPRIHLGGNPLNVRPRPPAMTPGAVNVGSTVHITAACVEVFGKSSGNVLDISCDFHVGDRLMVQDTVYKLCEVEILEVRTDSEIRVHYIGWPSKWDEWLAITSPRIQRPARIPRANVSNMTGTALQLTALVGRMGVVIKIKSVPATTITSPKPDDAVETLLQVQVVDPELGSTVCFWTKLNLVRVVEEIPLRILQHGLQPALSSCESLTAKLCSLSAQTLISCARRLLVSLLQLTQNSLLCPLSDTQSSPQLNISSPASNFLNFSSPQILVEKNEKDFGVPPLKLPALRATVRHQELQLSTKSFGESVRSLPRVLKWGATLLQSPGMLLPFLPLSKPQPFVKQELCASALHAGVVAEFLDMTTVVEAEIAELTRDTQNYWNILAQEDSLAIRIGDFQNVRNGVLPLVFQPVLIETFAQMLTEDPSSCTHNCPERIESKAAISRLGAGIASDDAFCLSEVGITTKSCSSESIPNRDEAFCGERCLSTLGLNWLSQQLSQTSLNLRQSSELHAIADDPPSLRVFKPEQSSLIHLNCDGVDSLVIFFVNDALYNFDISFYNAEKTVLLRKLSGAQGSMLPGAGASQPPEPFLVPNPVWIETSARAKVRVSPSEQELDVGDEDCSLIALPFRSEAADDALRFVQLLLYLWKRENISSPNRAGLSGLIRNLFDSLRDFLLDLHHHCPWPSHLKASCFEALAGLMSCMTGPDSIPNVPDNRFSNEFLLNLDIWRFEPIINEARARFIEEKERAPMMSSYLQRAVEFLIAAVRLESRSARLTAVSHFNPDSDHREPPGLMDEIESDLDGSIDMSMRDLTGDELKAKAIDDVSELSVDIHISPPNDFGGHSSTILRPTSSLAPSFCDLKCGGVKDGQQSHDNLPPCPSDPGECGMPMRSIPSAGQRRRRLHALLLERFGEVLEVDACMRRSALALMRVTELCSCSLCEKSKLKFSIFQKVVNFVDFTSGFWVSTLQLSLRNLPAELRLRLFDSTLKVSFDSLRCIENSSRILCIGFCNSRTLDAGVFFS